MSKNRPGVIEALILALQDNLDIARKQLTGSIEIGHVRGARDFAQIATDIANAILEEAGE